MDPHALSTRYKGLPKHNPLQYALWQIQHDTNELRITLLPTPNATVLFAQPAVRKVLAMSKAEQAIQDQRAHTLQFMMHHKPGGDMNANANKGKVRLLDKLQKHSQKRDDAEEEEAKDVMGDVTFRLRKGSGGKQCTI